MQQTALGAVKSSSSFGVIDLFWQTDLVTKVDLLLLFVASVLVWAIIFEKIGVTAYLSKSVKDFETKFWSGGSLDALFDSLKKKRLNPVSSVFVAAMKEWHRAGIYTKGDKNSLKTSGVLDRIERVMYITMDREKDKLERRMIFLATMVVTAPFMGLFGTVWGIMDIFHAIGLSGNAHLAAIAPGLAEALYTTILGLVVAIPAVLAYNLFTKRINSVMNQTEAFVGEFMAILSRKIDEAGK